MSRNERLIALEARALKRVKRRQVSITVALLLDRPNGRVLHWQHLTTEAQRLADTLWMARVNPRVLEASRG